MPDGGDRNAADPGVLLIENAEGGQAERSINGDLREHEHIVPFATDIYDKLWRGA
jgi:hypothetical protein